MLFLGGYYGIGGVSGYYHRSDRRDEQFDGVGGIGRRRDRDGGSGSGSRRDRREERARVRDHSDK